MMIEYICNNCRYRFKRQPDVTVYCCPYCSKRDTVKTVKSSGKAAKPVKKS